MAKYGITEPISTDPPTPEETALSARLLDALTESGFFEPEDEGVKREMVLGQLNFLVREFVTKVGMQQGMSEDAAAEAGGKIFTFGSYRLGVHNKGADIDTLCVVPNNVTRADFFATFQDMLQSHPLVTELRPVPDAHVPLVKFYYDNIPIDLLFCSISSLSCVPDHLDNLLDTNLLRHMDDKCVLSINGSRTTDEILTLVPDVPTFRLALRCIKLWAKRRGLYSNAMGYVGGVACAILTARICQLYPNSAACVIVSRFFSIYLTWNWPQPVMLRRIEYGLLGLRVWNPRVNPLDRNHRMPIITPAFPAICSTHNVTQSTLNLMLREMRRGVEVMREIEQGGVGWGDLFAPADYFHRFRRFLQMVAVSRDQTQARQWHGYIESRVRMLVGKLDQITNVANAPPYPGVFERQVSARSVQEVLDSLVAGGVVDEQAEGGTAFYAAVFYVALEIRFADDQGPRRVNLAGPVSEFKRLVLSWDKLGPGMEFHIRDLKQADLPDEVFGDQPRPAKRVKSGR